MNINPKLLPYEQITNFTGRFYIPSTLQIDTVLSFLGKPSRISLDKNISAPEKFDATVYPRRHVDTIETFIEKTYNIKLFSTMITEGSEIYIAKYILSQPKAELTIKEGIIKFMKLVEKEEGKAYIFTDNIFLNEQVFYTLEKDSI